MLVRHGPPVFDFAQSDGESQANVGSAFEVCGRAAAQQGEGIGDLGAGGNLKCFDVEHGAGGLPLKEAWPGVAVCVDVSDAAVGWCMSNMTMSV